MEGRVDANLFWVVGGALGVATGGVASRFEGNLLLPGVGAVGGGGGGACWCRGNPPVWPKGVCGLGLGTSAEYRR